MSYAKILVVEDEPMSALHIQTRLEFMGYRVIAAVSSGEDALRIIKQTPPDLVLMDVNLAGEMDGIDTTEQIQSAHDIPVVFLTACDDEQTLQRARITTPYGYLLKPFSERELHVTLEIALYRHAVDVERKQAEARQHQLEAQLRQAQKLESIGILAGGIAHDFNNILGTMLGYTELLLTEFQENPKVQTYLDHIYRAGERAADLIARLLTFSRTNEPQPLVPLLLPVVLEDALKMIRELLPTSVVIQADFPAVCQPILAEKTQLQQILLNLCVNAAQAMDHDGGTLCIMVEDVLVDAAEIVIPALMPGRYVKLTVSDTGRGMTPEIMEHIFDPFFTTKDPGQGVGLGLSIVHGIVKGFQGEIAVTSHPEQGTTFEIFFPATIPSPAGLAPATLPEHTPPTKGRGHVLIVEDEPALAKLYTISLMKAGYQVSLCHNGAEALALFQAQPEQFDLVFTDYTMPTMSGMQLSQELLRIRPTLPIILTTGYSERLSEAQVKAAGIRAFLMKPVKVHALLECIQQILAAKF